MRRSEARFFRGNSRDKFTVKVPSCCVDPPDVPSGGAVGRMGLKKEVKVYDERFVLPCLQGQE